MIKNLSKQDYIDGILASDSSILARAITLVESKRDDHQKLAKEIIHALVSHTGKARRIGISGTPGVGKSTFIESFGKMLTSKNLKVAVLAIDPTSGLTGGSILGDKTRMQNLASDPRAFIRPSPSGESLGGIASKTREAMLLCEAAGYDVIIIETVGVGQSEVTVSKVVDFFLLLMQPGGGDDLQGIKRGILELADLVAINKADGDLLTQAKMAKLEYEAAIHILRQTENWQPSVLMCSGLTGIGIESIWDKIDEYYAFMQSKNLLEVKRQKQLKQWIWDLLISKIQESIMHNENMLKMFNQALPMITGHEKSVLDIVDELYQKFFGKPND